MCAGTERASRPACHLRGFAGVCGQPEVASGPGETDAKTVSQVQGLPEATLQEETGAGLKPTS